MKNTTYNKNRYKGLKSKAQFLREYFEANIGSSLKEARQAWIKSNSCYLKTATSITTFLKERKISQYQFYRSSEKELYQEEYKMWKKNKLNNER